MLIKGLRFTPLAWFSLSCAALGGIFALLDDSSQAPLLQLIAGISGVISVVLVLLSARPRRANMETE